MYDPRPHTYQRIGRQFAGFMAGLHASRRNEELRRARDGKARGEFASVIKVNVAAARRAHHQFLKAVREIP